jgi:hypothetical protein
MANDQAIQSLVGLRGAVGAGAWLTPRISGRLFGLDPDGNPQAPYLARLFGVRDVALAVGLKSSSDSERAQWLRLGIACDLADAAAGFLAGRRGELPKLATVLVTATALSAAALGVVALQGEQPPPAAA